VEVDGKIAFFNAVADNAFAEHGSHTIGKQGSKISICSIVAHPFNGF
jgi:hypothetical protein